MLVTLEKRSTTNIIVLLPVLALCIDIFSPLLIWSNLIPSTFRWSSHFVIVLIMALTIIRMLGWDRIPRAFWLIVAISVLWSYIAIGRGQGVVPTIWGIWLLFQFPFICLFMYLQPNPPEAFTPSIRKYGLTLLGLTVGVQIIQFFSGMTPGDDLAGLFGRNGVIPALFFLLLVICVQLGHWITSRKRLGLVIALGLGIISSVLGEMKMFLPAIVAIGLLAIVLFCLRYRTPIAFLVYSSLLISVPIGFVTLYNAFVPGAADTPIETYYTNPAKLSEYINQTHTYVKNGQEIDYIGRGVSLNMGLETLQKDQVIFLFGYGIGSASESQTLGTSGISLSQANRGLSGGTSLLVIMQEFGLIGLILLAGFVVWTILRLVRDIHKFPASPALELRYALLLFSLLWPVWLWYSSVWTLRVPMCLYWLTLGYVLAESHMPVANQQLPVVIKHS